MATKNSNVTIDKMNQAIACFHRNGKIVINKDEHPEGRRAWEIQSKERKDNKSFTMTRDKGFCNYHEDWNILMEVVHKIEKKTKVMVIHKNSCALKKDLPYYQGATTIRAVHTAVYETIKTLL